MDDNYFTVDSPYDDIFYPANHLATPPAVLVVAPESTHGYGVGAPTLSLNDHLPIEPSLIKPDSTLSLADVAPAGDESFDGQVADGEEGGPQPFLDENGQQAFPCPHCAKVYTGKHARSIWRRHLADKHSVPLSQQPRRTRWDSVTDRPKTDTERRERTLESKRRWARKNRATQRAKAAGLPVPTDADFDENGFPHPGTALAAVVNAVRRTGQSETAGSGSTPSAAPSPMLMPQEEDEVPSTLLSLPRYDLPPPPRLQRASSLVPPANAGRPQFQRNVSEPPAAVYGASVESSREPEFYLGAPSSSRALYASEASSSATQLGDDGQAPTSSLRDVIHPDLLHRGYVDGVSPAKAALQPAAKILPGKAPASSPRRSARLAHDPVGVSPEEAAIQLLALKSSSPNRSPARDADDSYAATNSTTLMSDFSFQLPHDGTSPASSPVTDSSKGASKRSMIETDKELDVVKALLEEESAQLRPTKRSRRSGMALDTPSRPLLPLRLPKTTMAGDEQPLSSPEGEDEAVSLAMAARSAFAHSTPHHPTIEHFHRSSPAAGLLFSSPGNTDLSRSLGLVPDSKLSVFGTPGLKGSSPVKPGAWAMPNYPGDGLMLQSSPEKDL